MKVKFKTNISLSNLTTFGAGGVAKYFVDVSNKSELVKVVDFAKEKKLPILILGGGSNVLISDKEFPGLVIRYKAKKVLFKKQGKSMLVIADAGLNWDVLVAKSVRKGLQGIECMSGIPGTVGAAPVQNIGAYGQELKDVFVKLVAYDLKKGEFQTFDKKKCEFSYRESTFKKSKNRNRYIIINVVLRLRKNSQPTLVYQSLLDYLKEKKINNPSLQKVRNAVLELRKRKLEDPKKLGNAGSFFKNPFVKKHTLSKLLKRYPDLPYQKESDNKYKLFAAWLINKAGWRGKVLGRAMVSEKNPLVITNPNRKASADEIKKLSEKIKKDIKKKFGVELETEVQFTNFV